MAVIGLAFVVTVTTAAVHVAGRPAHPAMAARSQPVVPVADGATPLPLLSPPVQALTGDSSTLLPAPTPASSPEAAPSTTASGTTDTAPSIASILPSLPIPQDDAASPPSGRLSRADALPGPPLAAGASSVPATGGQSGQARAGTNPLTSQYAEHTVAAGETLSSIASSYNVTVDSVIGSNPELDDFDLIQPGQTLRVPTTNGILYNVQAGDTLSAISQRYGISPDDVVKVSANALKSADDITVGQTILLPGNLTPPPPPPPVIKPLVAPPSPPIAASASSSSSDNSSVPATPAATAAPAPTPEVARFIWPITGPITQPFGVPELGVGAPHTGIDIGLYGRDGAPIAAAAAGTVIFSGGDACCGYGYYVVIQHKGGFTTLYGHLSRRAVSVGDTVSQGQTVGYAGDTGFSTGTHLHFEMHLNGNLVDPMDYLP
jgi:murein DD-endopeptidase MepM/ murein hydrolase activator NlpD